MAPQRPIVCPVRRQAQVNSVIQFPHSTAIPKGPEILAFPNLTQEKKHMKRTLAAVCCIVLASVPALAQKKAAAGKAMTDQQFVEFAAQTDMMEANLGQLAANAASSQQVKDYASTLVTDHTNDFGQLGTAAKQANLNVPNAIDAAHNKMLAPFEKLKGAAFDRKYAQEMVAGHTKAIEMYKKEASDGQNDAIKSYAQTALPVLEKHLTDAKDLEKAKPSSK
jgi:putative membrane protein